MADGLFKAKEWAGKSFDSDCKSTGAVIEVLEPATGATLRRRRSRRRRNGNRPRCPARSGPRFSERHRSCSKRVVPRSAPESLAFCTPSTKPSTTTGRCRRAAAEPQATALAIAAPRWDEFTQGPWTTVRNKAPVYPL